MPKLRCLLVDDEPLALRLLAGYVERIPFLELVGTCRSAIEAMQVLQREQVDVLFLDVQMPDLTGVEFVRTIRPQAAVVFTTAYKQYAVEGFDLDAVDYLIKPIPFDRFLKAATKVQERLQPAAPPAPVLVAAPVPPAAPVEEYIFVKADYHTQRVTLRDIRYLEGLKDYVKIHLGAAKPLLTLNSLRAFEERLPATDFVRVHRSYIVALNWIDSIRKNRIYMGEVVIPIGDAYAESFHQLIEQRNMH